MNDASVLKFKETTFSSSENKKSEKDVISFETRFTNSCSIDIEKTKNSIIKYLVKSPNEAINKEILDLVTAFINLDVTDGINIKILNLFLSIKDKYILINFENKNIVIQNEKEFVDFMQRLNVSILMNEKSYNKIVYTSMLTLDSEDSNYCFSSSVSKLSDNDLHNTLILSIHINSLFQKILLIVYKEFRLEIKKNLEKNLPTIG